MTTAVATAPQTAPRAVKRSDYRAPDHVIDTVDLSFDLQDDFTTVKAKLAMRRPGPKDAPLVLDGEALDTVELKLDGRALAAGTGYRIEGEKLVIASTPASYVLETTVRLKPEQNTELSGLYKSSGNYCTQCEAMGFRRITWFLDRPDVMAKYTTTIQADKKRYPVLLGNGNKPTTRDLPGGRHEAKWVDPWPKPSYLFALVAGSLHAHRGTFTTRSGKQVALEVWVEPQNADKCEHALVSLQRSMKWDEDVYGREYDLDVYMIVAVNDFNMGAMENKGLNIFNSKYVLARPETATDEDYEGIEGVIGHEYFHNWTGNRVTCKDWFQLTLKEGLTVFRDQQFTADMTSAPVKRVSDVRGLRLGQFPEDAGPMSHPIRPEQYISMDNFYTATVYRKGAEVIRMIHTLVGAAGFRAGMDLYFQRHDGSAVTCDDFVQAFEDACKVDLSQFRRWYEQNGTPLVKATGEHDAKAQTYTLTLEQSIPTVTAAGGTVRALHIPVRVGLLGSKGQDLPLRLQGEPTSGAAPTTRVLELKQASQRFVFTGIGVGHGGQSMAERPVASILRDFSAPVRVKMERSRAELAFLVANDADAFNRWDAGQELAQQVLLALATDHAAGRPLVLDPAFVDAFGKVLDDARLDGSLKAMALVLPAELQLAQEQAVVDPDALHAAREHVRRELARALRPRFEAAYKANSGEKYQNDKRSIDRRRLKNVALAYLSVLNDAPARKLVATQLETADNMTDAAAALSLLASMDCPERATALASFHARWKDDPLVLDKWFTAQAISTLPDTVQKVEALRTHADFSLKNPNRVRSLVGAFGASNQVRFHQKDGAGYAWLADRVLELDSLNPQVASRMVSCMNPWRRFDAGRQALIKAQLERIAARPGLSKDVFEIVQKALGVK